MAALEQAAHHVGAHPAEADHSELHLGPPTQKRGVPLYLALGVVH